MKKRPPQYKIKNRLAKQCLQGGFRFYTEGCAVILFFASRR